MTNPKEMTTWETAWAAAGQPVGAHSQIGPYASVLQMALVGCGIANDGKVMTPYLVQNVYNSNGERSYTASPSVLSQAISKSTADRVKEVLKGVVSNGTGTAVQISGVEIAGKTGTAETGPRREAPCRQGREKARRESTSPVSSSTIWVSATRSA